MVDFSILTLALMAVNIVLGVGIVIILYLVFKFGTRTPTIVKDPNWSFALIWRKGLTTARC